MKTNISVKKILKTHKHFWAAPVYGIFYLLIFSWLEERLQKGVPYHIIECPLDRMIPFCEYFVIFYYAWFLYVFLTFMYFLIADKNDREFNHFMMYLGAGMTVFLIVSWIWPNGLDLRPEVLPRDNIFCRLVAFIYSKDTPTNVFPSIHVFNSVSCWLAIRNSDPVRGRKRVTVPIFILTVMIVLSTAFLKQHSVYDIAGGIAMSAVFYYLIYRPATVSRPASAASQKTRTSS